MSGRRDFLDPAFFDESFEPARAAFIRAAFVFDGVVFADVMIIPSVLVLTCVRVDVRRARRFPESETIDGPRTVRIAKLKVRALQHFLSHLIIVRNR